MTFDLKAKSGMFDIDSAAFMAEIQKLTAKLPRTETTHGLGVNLIYLFLSKKQKNALLQVHYQQVARHILESIPEDASELHWFSAIVSSYLVSQGESSNSPFFEFLKRNKEQYETTFRNKIEIYVQERAAQRFPDDPKANYAIADAIRYVAKMTMIEREQLDKIYYYLNHYHPAKVSLFTRATYRIKLLETATQIIVRKIKELRQALSQFSEAKINHDLEMRMLSLKRLKESELKVFVHLFDLMLYLGAHDPLHEVLVPLRTKLEENFQNMVNDFQLLHKKNVAKSGEIARKQLLETQQNELVQTYNELKEKSVALITNKEQLEQETEKYRQQKVTEQAIQFLQQRIVQLEKENTQLMDDYYSFKVKLLNIVPSESEEEQILEAAWQEHLQQKTEKNTGKMSLYDEQFLETEINDNGGEIKVQEIDEDLLDETTRINLAEISPQALKVLNNRLEIRIQKLKEINTGLEQQNKFLEQRIAKLKELKQHYFESKEFDAELEKQALEAHCTILLKDKKRNTERLKEIEWKFAKLLEIYQGDKTEIRSVLDEIERKYAADQHHLHDRNE